MTNTPRDDPPKMGWNYAKAILEVGALLFLLVLVRIYGTRHLHVDELQAFMAGLGMLAPLVFIVISAVVVMTPVPAMLAIGAGSLGFGTVVGATYALVGMTVGACAAFLTGRRYLMGDIAARLKRRQLLKRRLMKADELLQRRGLVGIIGLRLAFSNSFILNYAVGSTSTATRDFLLGTFIGLIPRTFLTAYLFGLLGRTSFSGNALLHPDLLLLIILVATRIWGMLMLGLVTMLPAKEIG